MAEHAEPVHELGGQQQQVEREDAPRGHAHLAHLLGRESAAGLSFSSATRPRARARAVARTLGTERVELSVTQPTIQRAPSSALGSSSSASRPSGAYQHTISLVATYSRLTMCEKTRATSTRGATWAPTDRPRVPRRAYCAAHWHSAASSAAATHAKTESLVHHVCQRHASPPSASCMNSTTHLGRERRGEEASGAEK